MVTRKRTKQRGSEKIPQEPKEPVIVEPEPKPVIETLLNRAYKQYMGIIQAIAKKRSEKMLETLLNGAYKPYMGIISLTYHFQNQNAIPGKVGLQLKHYRYALVKKDDMGLNYREDMGNFFERPRASHENDHSNNDLTAVKYRRMCETKEIEKCISSRNNLSKTYLKNLVKAGILVKDKPERKTTDDGKKHKYDLKTKKETPLYYINPEKKKEIDVIIRKYQLKKLVESKIDDSNETNFQILEKKIYEVLFS